MDSVEKKALQEKLFRRLNTRVSEAAQGLRLTARDLFRQIEELSAELGRRVEEEALEAVGAVADELSRARETATRAEERTSGLARSVRSVLEQKDQLSVLEALLEGALRFSDGAALFVLKDLNLGGWRSGGRIENSRARSVHFPLSSKNTLARSLRDREALCVTGDYSHDDSVFFDELGSGRPAGIVAVPLVIREKAQAVLFGAGYDDRNTLGQLELEAYRALAAAAMSAIWNIQGQGRQESGVDQAAPRPAPPVTPPPAKRPAREPGVPSAAAENRQQAVSAPTPAPVPAAETTPHVPPVSRPPAPAPAVTAPEMSGQPNKPRSPWFPPASRSSALGSRDAVSERRDSFALLRPETDEVANEPLGPEEQELHDDARRFARLLVSEIKLYNEAKVAEGREERDLYHRLRSDIERSRQMYNERVPPSIAAKTNYFMDELVSILAEGDRSALGM
jgi:hypothetical protein